MTRPRDVECCRDRAIHVEDRIGKSQPVAGAGPRPVFGTLHQSAPNRIEMDVFHESVQCGGFQHVLIVSRTGLPEAVVGASGVRDGQLLQKNRANAR